MSEVYKTILNTIAEPMCSLTKEQIEGVIERLKKGNTDDKIIADSVSRLNRYIYMTLQLVKEMGDRYKIETSFKERNE